VVNEAAGFRRSAEIGSASRDRPMRLIGFRRNIGRIQCAELVSGGHVSFIVARHRRSAVGFEAKGSAMEDVSRIKLFAIVLLVVTVVVLALEHFHVPGFHTGPVVLHSRSI
jgi:hypothetical protein